MNLPIYYRITTNPYTLSPAPTGPVPGMGRYSEYSVSIVSEAITETENKW